MVLAVDIENSSINFGLFDSLDAFEPSVSFKIATDIKKTSDEYMVTVSGILAFYKVEIKNIFSVVVASVVPQLTAVLLDALHSLLGVDAMTVGKGTKSGFPIKIDNPSELGADLVANAAAVLSIQRSEGTFKTPAVIVDMGTATTVFALNGNGEYIGGSILPGIGISLDALHGKTAQLPTVSPDIPSRAIGKNSLESVRSGVILGNAMMIDGFIERFSREMRCQKELSVFVTGEYAQSVMPFCSHKMRYVSELTLIGLFCIYKNNIKV